MPETQYKICPRCQAHAALEIKECASCGRPFPTRPYNQFAPPFPPSFTSIATYRVMGANERWSPPITQAQLVQLACDKQITPGTRIIDALDRKFFYAHEHPQLCAIFKQAHVNQEAPLPKRSTHETSPLCLVALIGGLVLMFYGFFTYPRPSEYAGFARAGDRLCSGERLYFSSDRTQKPRPAFEVLGGNTNYGAYGGRVFDGVKVRFPDGGEEWIDRTYITGSGKYFVKENDPALSAARWQTLAN